MPGPGNRKLLWVGYQPVVGSYNSRAYPATNPLSKFDFGYGPNWRELDSSGILYQVGHPSTDGNYISSQQKGPVPGDEVYIGYSTGDRYRPVNYWRSLSPDSYGVPNTIEGVGGINPYATAGSPCLFGGFSGSNTNSDWGTWISYPAFNNGINPVSAGVYDHTNYQSALASPNGLSTYGGGTAHGVTFSSALSAVYIGYQRMGGNRQELVGNYPYAHVGGGIWSASGVSFGSLEWEISKDLSTTKSKAVYSYIPTSNPLGATGVLASEAELNAYANAYTKRGLYLKTPLIMANNPSNAVTGPIIVRTTAIGGVVYQQGVQSNGPAGGDVTIRFADCVMRQNQSLTGQNVPWHAQNNNLHVGHGFTAADDSITVSNCLLGNYTFMGGKWNIVDINNCAGFVTLCDGREPAGATSHSYHNDTITSKAMFINNLYSNCPGLYVRGNPNYYAYPAGVYYNNANFNSSYYPTTPVSVNWYYNAINYRYNLYSGIMGPVLAARQGPIFAGNVYAPLTNSKLSSSITGSSGTGNTYYDGGINVINPLRTSSPENDLVRNSTYQPSIYLGELPKAGFGVSYVVTRIPKVTISNSWATTKQGEWQVKVLGALDADKINVSGAKFAIANPYSVSTNPYSAQQWPDPGAPANSTDWWNQVSIKQLELGYNGEVDFSYAPNHNVAKIGGLSGGVLIGGIIATTEGSVVKGSEGVQLVTANLAQGGLVSFRAGAGQSGGTVVGKDFTNITWANPSQLELEAEETPARGEE